MDEMRPDASRVALDFLAFDAEDTRGDIIATHMVSRSHAYDKENHKHERVYNNMWKKKSIYNMICNLPGLAQNFENTI